MTELARATGKKRSTVHTALAAMSAAGTAVVDAGTLGTSVRLLAS